MFQGVQGWLHYLLWTLMPANIRLSLESLDIITKTKVGDCPTNKHPVAITAICVSGVLTAFAVVALQDVDPQVICWKGASVVCLMDTAHELWITQKEWTKLGLRILREKAMFIW